MYEYITGEIIELTPTEIIVDNNGVGYKFLISLNSYSSFSKIRDEKRIKVFIYHHLREEEELFYGFYTKDERDIFILLRTVSGIGSNSARMMLSSMTPEEIQTAIVSGDVDKIKSIKGIGLKKAQKVIIELKDKMDKRGSGSSEFILDTQINSVRQEALSALILLGFSRNGVEKVLASILKKKSDISLEELIKLALKQL